MTRVALPWTKPPLTKNRVRRMHHHAEAKARRATVDTARWAIRATKHLEPLDAATIVLHWRMGTRRRQDGDGASPTLSACIEAVVLEGVIPDDSWRHVPHSGTTCHPPQPGQPGAMWLTITDPEEAP